MGECAICLVESPKLDSTVILRAFLPVVDTNDDALSCRKQYGYTIYIDQWHIPGQPRYQNSGKCYLGKDTLRNCGTAIFPEPILPGELIVIFTWRIDEKFRVFYHVDAIRSLKFRCGGWAKT